MSKIETPLRRVMAATLFFVGLAHCAGPTANSADAFEKLAGAVQAQAGHTVAWHKDDDAPARVRERIEHLLSGDLDERSAVALALLNSNHLQAHFEKLAMVHGELVTGLSLKNPLLTVLGRVPSGPGVAFGEVNFLQSFLELLLLPWRRAQADIDMQRVGLEIGQIVLDTIRDVRVAYHQAQASERVASLRTIMLADVQKASELAAFRSRSKEVDDIKTALARATYQQMKLDLARAELDLLLKREALAELLGLQRVPAAWSLHPLPEIPAAPTPLAELEKLALQTRMDVAATEARVRLMAKALKIAENSAFVGTVLVGGALNHDAAGATQYGPTLVLELPIFNRRQGQIEQLRAALRKAEREAQQARVAVQSRVRRAHGALAVAREMAESFASALLPLRRRITELSAHDADATGRATSAWDVVLARQAELQTQCEWAEAAHGYWQQRAHLEHAVGLDFLSHGGRLR